MDFARFLTTSLAAALLSISPAVAPERRAPTDPPASVEIPSGGVRVPMKRIHRIPAVEVSISGSRPFLFVIDFGANVLALSPRVARELALPLRGADAMGKETVEVDALAVGGARLRGLVAAVEPFFDDKEEQGVLGLNVFRDLMVTLDYPRAEVRLERGELPVPDGRRILEYRPRAGGSAPIVPISIAGRADDAILDTGASGWLLVSQSRAPELPWKSPPVEAGVAVGPQSGRRRVSEGRLDGRVTVGEYTVEDPAVALMPPGRPATMLGSGLLEHFAVTLDQRRSRVRFERTGAGPIRPAESPPDRSAAAADPAPPPTAAKSAASRAPALPDSPEGKRLAAFLEAAESGTEAAVRAFIERNFSPAALRRMPVEPRLRRIRQLIERYGPFELVGAGAPRADRIGMRVRSKKNGNLYDVSLELEEGAARELLGVDVEEAEEGGSDDTVKRTDRELSAATDAWVTQLAAKETFSGVVLLARGGNPFFTKAWGLADRGLSVPNRVDTKFNVGSIGKTFTRAAVMDLARAGRLSLEDTAVRLLPGIQVPSAGRITVRQLLEMTSGLGDIFGEKYDATAKQRLRTLGDFLPLFEKEPLRFEPGQGRAYSNAGYVLLGLIVEKVSGRPYWEFVRERVFGPAEMGETGPWGPDEVIANRAVGYTRAEGGGWRSNVYALPGRPSSAGGVHSTAGDLLRFVSAVDSGRVATSPSAAERGRSAVGIAGGTDGANAVIDSDGELTVIVLANLDPPAAERIASRIRRWSPAPGPR